MTSDSSAVVPQGVHLVGSINLSTTPDVFAQVPALLPNRLRRIPDGETGKRDYFVRWQLEVFADLPGFSAELDTVQVNEGPKAALTDEQIASALNGLPELHTGYDTAALESYEIFREHKALGLIPKETRFQVCLPGIVNVIAIARIKFPELAPHLEPHYERALVRSLDAIQAAIPHDELAIQLDVAVEFAFLEEATFFGPSYFQPVFPGVIDRLSRFAKSIADDVEFGFHFCYGDVEHAHFTEPKDLSMIVKVANALHKEINHPIQWIHVPVPKDRKDAEFIEPLKTLAWDVPELYLGLVHSFDEEGTIARIDTARKVLGEQRPFGIATECGLGRTPQEEFSSIMGISVGCSGPGTVGSH